MFREKLKKEAMRLKKPPECNLKKLFTKILKKGLSKAGKMSKKELKTFTIRLLKK